VDVVFVIAAIVISESFPERDQALAGAVFNTVANLGQALGLAIIAVVTNTVTQNHGEKDTTQGLLEGYRAGFWVAFGWMILTAFVSAFGLRRVGKVGVKRD
jgi:MFS family permease